MPRASVEVIQAVKEAYPQVVIEAHDRVNGGLQDYHPLYFQHGLPHSFDENWGFEYMWDPYYDLLSGKALSLYEYNLAYDIPLYLHIHEGRDSTHHAGLLVVCLHLPAPGHRRGQRSAARPLYAALKAGGHPLSPAEALLHPGRVRRHRPVTHLHVLPERNAAVAVLFNLSDQPETRTILIDLARAGLRSIDRVVGARLEQSADSTAVLVVEISALSPVLIELNVSSEAPSTIKR